MKARICWTKDGIFDSMTIEGDDLDEIKKLADAEIEKRQPDEFWSEDIER